MDHEPASFELEVAFFERDGGGRAEQATDLGDHLGEDGADVLVVVGLDLDRAAGFSEDRELAEEPAEFLIDGERM